ncbi:hypothetical protein QBC34DRAFT_357436 [Podospora aff. communis PSN243]|uniref:Peptide hydrolase n=1 Tax=Podospora aff. communis PSN243 TaxID=3040156 RepID=A0AAV9GBP0_9PEZI|nr:hypothetical protein QBC34DRAFT_357436 [Podospora aff. communis PSN243]
MQLRTILALVASSAWLTAAAPSVDAVDRRAVRLVKTSPEDIGTWITEEEKLVWTAQGKHFVDITDITDPEVLAILSTPNSEDVSLAARAITYPTSASKQSTANPLISQVSNSQPQAWLSNLCNFYNRYYRGVNGTAAGNWLFNTVSQVAAANPAITVSRFTHSFNQPSIIVKIPGSSPNLVIVGAHYDSTGGSATARAPGADDNGSGVVVILEALRVLANARYSPKNTLEFHFYGGEEGGLLGSAAVFSNYKSTGKNVLAMVNQDMTGYSPGGKITVYTDYVDSGLTAYARVVATAYTGSTSSDRCGYACSDHGSARSNGFPAAYIADEPMSTSSPYIHSPSDAYSTIQWPAILRHSKFTVAFLVEASFL